MPGRVVAALTRDRTSPAAPGSAGTGSAYERARLAALRRYRVLDTDPEEAFDDLTRLATQLLDIPTSVMSLIDVDRQWFKSRLGVPVCETPREYSFCELALGSSALVVAGDTSLDSRFDRFGDQPYRSYAGAPLVTPDGYVLGTLCVFDLEPRT
ncbi:MAG: hypothetical protein JWL64_472, partial [Frankiales bacterium]|nr:hypothetical protein [Frankiales bacterium]